MYEMKRSSSDTSIEETRGNINRLRTFSENIKLVKERREHIRKCVTALSINKPFEKLSTDEILRACKMSRGSLYYYIRSKEDILSLIQEHTAEGYLNVYQSLLKIMDQKCARDVLRQATQIFCKWVEDYQDEMIITLHETVNAQKGQREQQLNAERRNIEVIESIIREGVITGEFKTDDPRIVAHAIYLNIRAWADKRWFLRRNYSLEQYTESITKLALIMLGSEKVIEIKK